MQKQIQISAVIPTYNRAAFVGRAIESALRQEYPPSEIIVVDDGSVDDTRRVLNSYGDRVRCLFQPNAGVSTARNRGVREARYEWIAFLDSDDCWVPGHLRRMVNAIGGTQSQAALYFADLEIPDANGASTYWGFCKFGIGGGRELKQDAGEWALMRIQPMMLQASVISRAAYLQVGGLAEQLRIREDTLIFFKLALQYPACAVSGCGTVMRADDKMRLTRLYDQGSHIYCDATIFLFRDLLATLPDVGVERHRFLRDCLESAYVGKSRVFFGQHKYWPMMKTLALSAATSPAAFTKEVFQWLKRGLFTTTRPTLVDMDDGAVSTPEDFAIAEVQGFANAEVQMDISPNLKQSL